MSPAAVLATIFFKNPSSMVILFLTIRVRSVRSQRNCAVHRYYQISKCQKNPPLSRIRTYLAPTSGSSSPKLSSNRRDYLILCYIRSPPFLDLARVSFTQIFSFPKPPRTHSIVAFKSRKLETHIRLYDLLKSSPTCLPRSHHVIISSISIHGAAQIPNLTSNCKASRTPRFCQNIFHLISLPLSLP